MRLWGLKFALIILLLSVSNKRVDGQSRFETHFECSEEFADSLLDLAENLTHNSYRDSAKILTLKVLKCCRSLNHRRLTARALLQLGSIAVGSYGPQDAPVRYLLESLSIYIDLNDTLGIIRCNLQLGVLNFTIQNYESAIDRFNKILDLNQTQISNHQQKIAQYLLALSYSELGEFKKANLAFKYVEEHHDSTDLDFWLLVQSFKGKMLLNQGNPKKSVQLLEDFYRRNKEYLETKKPSPFHAFLATAYYQTGQAQKAKSNALKAYTMAMGEGSEIIYFLESLRTLHKVYFDLGMSDSAYYYLTQLKELEDTEQNNRVLQRTAQINGQFEFEQELKARQATQALKDQKIEQEQVRDKLIRNALIIGLGIAFILIFLIFKQRNKVNKERKRSEDLLLNILPAQVANELKNKGEATAKKIDNVTVLFTDFKGFTKYSELVSPEVLVKDLHESFTAFDRITARHGIEKIKTIGDAYMAAGGLSNSNSTETENVVKAALEILHFIEKGRSKKIAENKPFFEIRIGIHTGPVVAGIVGVNKFSYDIWGDTVNTANRLESYSEVGKINISRNTYLQIVNYPDFNFESRGEVEVKGKGKIEMYFVYKNNTQNNLSTQ